jgi:hypothetical protein
MLRTNLFKRMVLGLAVFAAPLLLVNCNDDDDGGGGPDKPSEGQADVSFSESSGSLPDSFVYFDTTDYDVLFDLTVDRAVVINGIGDSANMTLTFIKDSDAESPIGPGTYQVKSFSSSSSEGVEVTYIGDGGRYSSYQSPLSDDDLGSVEIKEKTDDNVYVKLSDVVVRGSRNVTAERTLNGAINAKPQ